MFYILIIFCLKNRGGCTDLYNDLKFALIASENSNQSFQIVVEKERLSISFLLVTVKEIRFKNVTESPEARLVPAPQSHPHQFGEETI